MKEPMPVGATVVVATLRYVIIDVGARPNYYVQALNDHDVPVGAKMRLQAYDWDISKDGTYRIVACSGPL